MSKVVVYKGILDCYPILEYEYKNKMKELPCVVIRSFEGFLNEFSNKDDFIKKAFLELDVLKGKLFMNEMSIYLCIATQNLGESDKMQDYLKVWKKLKMYEIDNFHFGYEHKIIMNNSFIYSGNAKLVYKDINKALDVLYDNQNNSFIYITFDNELIKADKTKDLYNMLLYGKFNKIGCDMFDFSDLYNSMSQNASIIRLTSDGEEISMDIIQKCGNYGE